MPTKPADPRGGGEAALVMSLPANTAYVSVARAAAAGLASMLDWTLDELDDLRIAVDEASGMLLRAGASDGLHLECRRDGDHGLAVSLGASTGEAPLPADSFGWTVLRAVSDDAQVHTDGATTSITVHKTGHSEQR
ncbi:MAG: anti-sigma factor [Streptosporangiales bacterium]